MAEADLSRIVNLIMENPKLIAEIKNMASQNKENSEDVKEAAAIDTTETVELNENDATVANAFPQKNEQRSRRNSLLSALKPYVSEKRCQAIDSMMSIADILDVVRTR